MANANPKALDDATRRSILTRARALESGGVEGEADKVIGYKETEEIPDGTQATSTAPASIDSEEQLGLPVTRSRSSRASAGEDDETYAMMVRRFLSIDQAVVDENVEPPVDVEGGPMTSRSGSSHASTPIDRDRLARAVLSAIKTKTSGESVASHGPHPQRCATPEAARTASAGDSSVRAKDVREPTGADTDASSVRAEKQSPTQVPTGCSVGSTGRDKADSSPDSVITDRIKTTHETAHAPLGPAENSAGCTCSF